MKYEEIVKKVNAKESVSTRDITGVQMLMLMHDKVIKNFSYRNTLYEINFIPIEEERHIFIRINDNSCPTFKEASDIIENIVSLYKSGHSAFIDLDGEYFEIILEVLESNE